MKLFYIKASVFTSNYRCSMVRQRLIRFIKSNPPSAILVSGLKDQHMFAYQQFIEQCSNSRIRFIYEPGCYSIGSIPFELSTGFLRAGDLAVVPIEGTIAVVEKRTQCKATYMLFDMFADEDFSDYHGELDETSFKELDAFLKEMASESKK